VALDIKNIFLSAPSGHKSILPPGNLITQLSKPEASLMARAIFEDAFWYELGTIP
jgi:hypothetical protein